VNARLRLSSAAAAQFQGGTAENKKGTPMKIVSNLVRAAALAVFAIGASAFAPSSSGEAQAQSGYSYGGQRAQHNRAAPRPAYRHRQASPRRSYNRPVVRHQRPVVRHYGPRYRPMYVAPQRCVIRSRWVNTYSGPRLVRQRICR
jgi:hypothetical protein